MTRLHSDQKKYFKKALKSPETKMTLRQLHEWSIDYRDSISLALRFIRRCKKLASSKRQELIAQICPSKF